jgi:hypothetical protein
MLSLKEVHEVNLVVLNNHFAPDLCESLFGPLEWDESIIMLSPEDKRDVLDLLVEMGVFPSKGQARKNWKGSVTIPSGFSDFAGIGKMRRRLTIWNPMEET